MYEISMQHMSPDFFRCWQAAGKYLSMQVDGGLQTWLRAHPDPPFLEHLSFRLGNQSFFVRVVDVDNVVEGPGSLEGLFTVAKGCNGYACLMPMKKDRISDEWRPNLTDWGLVDAHTREVVNPSLLVSDDKVEITDWELHDFAVQIVRGYLKDNEYEIDQWQGNPDVDPAIWFKGSEGGLEWVVVRAVRFPEEKANPPSNWRNIAKDCAVNSEIGHFASVSFASIDQPGSDLTVPIWRGYGTHVRFAGLERILI